MTKVLHITMAILAFLVGVLTSSALAVPAGPPVPDANGLGVVGLIIAQGGFAAVAGVTTWLYIRERKYCAALTAEAISLAKDSVAAEAQTLEVLRQVQRTVERMEQQK